MFRRVRALLARLAGQGVPIGQDQPAEAAASVVAPPILSAPPGEPVLAGAAPLETAPAPAAVDDVVTAISPAPPSSEEELARAQKLLAAGKVSRAISMLEARLRTHPDADVAATLGDLRAIQRANKRLQRHPGDAQAHFDLGKALFSQEHGPEALDHLAVACQKRPGWLEARLLLAYELHWEARWQEAEAAYLAVLAIDPTHAVARRGLLAIRAFQPPDALILAHEAPPGDAGAHAAGGS